MFSKQVRNTSVSFDKKCKQNLADIMKKYHKTAQFDPIRLRHAIPSQEIWRYFIDGCLQKKGRELRQSRYFKDNHTLYKRVLYGSTLHYTVKEYATKIEGINFETKEDWRASELRKYLIKRKWYLKDEECKHIKLVDLLKMDRAWLHFERNEPGYLKALYIAFDKIFDMNAKLDLSFIKTLHKLAMEGVQNSNYDADAQYYNKKGEIRTSDPCSFALYPSNNCSRDGVFELLNKIVNDSNDIYKENIGIFIKTGGDSGFNINYDFIKEILNSDFENADDQIITDKFLKYCTGATKSLKELVLQDVKHILVKICKLKNINELANQIHHEIESHAKDRTNIVFQIQSTQPKDTNKQLEKKLETLISQFNKNIQNTNDQLNKFRIIVSFIQECEQLHPFYDGNCRTFCMLLLNHLLLKNGFPIAILENPNQFDLYSLQELIQSVIAGMQNTFTLIQAGELFHVKTDDILNFLNSKTYLKNIVNYFNDVVNIENSKREVKCATSCIKNSP